MNDSIKEKVMDEIARRLSLIKESSGYWTTVRIVQRTHDMAPERPTAPTVYVYEGQEVKDDQEVPNLINCSLPVGIVYACENQREKAQWANRMLQDIEVAVGLEYILTCPSGATVTAYFNMKSTDVHVDDQGGPVIVATCVLETQYRHAPGNPADVVCIC